MGFIRLAIIASVLLARLAIEKLVTFVSLPFNTIRVSFVCMCNSALHIAPVSVAKRRAGNSVFCFNWQSGAIVLLKLLSRIAH